MNDYTYADLVSMAVSNNPYAYHAAPITNKCKIDISNSFNIPEIILDTYLKTEGATAGFIRDNTDGTWDVGPMQINSSNWENFYEKFGVFPVDIRYNGCINLMVGAYLIRDHLNKSGKTNIDGWNSLFKIAANYHSKTPAINIEYQKKWIQNLKILLEEIYSER